MTFSSDYLPAAPTRAEIDAMAGNVLLEFGAPWCGYCQAAQPLLATALAARSDVQHIKVEDGSGQPLGRSFRIKLWPTVIALSDGEERARAVRPGSAGEIERLLSSLP